jgi:hypothetical protein
MLNWDNSLKAVNTRLKLPNYSARSLNKPLPFMTPSLQYKHSKHNFHMTHKVCFLTSPGINTSIILSPPPKILPSSQAFGWLRSFVVSVLPSLIPGATPKWEFMDCIFLSRECRPLCLHMSELERVPGITPFPGDATRLFITWLLVIGVCKEEISEDVIEVW